MLQRNKLGYTPAEAAAEINRLKTLFLLLPDSPNISNRWEKLVSKYQGKGVNVHDSRLVASIDRTPFNRYSHL
ncbi:hypothetical protein NG798_05465 [Ancylothrix sp. C2]|uniref:hypothetical protein n=1 Tax=Ancylothrix sp. D3o TaxID=2953691 RepID=UPI0021BA7617|nr:hypothetical protein [Ancylothrix sp. D3o]MCT7949229.1 hypothetical protein [Ancylothrix sp. D3o]